MSATTRSIEDGCVPLLNHRPLRNVVYDERESVDQCRDKASVRYPSVEDLQLLMTDTCQRSDEVALACGSEDKWQTSEGEPACSCSDRRRVAPMAAIVTWPVVRLWRKCHAEEVDGSDCTECQDTQWSRRPVQGVDTERPVAKEAYGRARQSKGLRRTD